MKRTLSLVLALVMVLGTFTSVFAAEATVEEKAGEILKALEVMTGDDAGLRLEDGLKREEAVVMIARLKGELETAQNFPTKPSYKDITNKAYEPLLAWAKEDGTFVGHNDEKFGFGDNITTQEYASVVLRILGYEVGVDKEITWNDVMAKAEELGLLKNIDADADFLRGNMAVMTLNALRSEMKDSKETLAEKLNLDVPAEEVELSTDIEIDSAKAVANNKVEVKVKEEVAASVADFTIVKKGTTTELEIKDVVKESAKVFVLETEALTAGTSYTVKSNGISLNFAGIAVDKTAPTVKVTAADTNRFKVEFSDVMDKVTAENIENYTFDKDLKVVKATLNSARKVVTLETDAAKKNTTYKLTIENVTNSDGVAMKKFSQNVRAIEYTTAPTISGTPKAISSTLVEITFNQGTYGMNKEALEAVENYTIEGLEVKEAKAYDKDEDAAGLYEVVLLTTEEQEANKSYKLTIAGVTDNSVLKNVIKTKTFSIRGMRADKTAPTVASAKASSNNEVKVMFTDSSAMDIASMADISNYKITYKDGSETVELAILEAEALAEGYPDAYDSANKGVILTTEEQIKGKAYVIEISDIEDEYGNAMKSTRKLTFTGEEEDVTPPTVKAVRNTDKGVVIEFEDKSDLNAALVKDPTNYTINGGVGTAISASYKASAKTVTLTTGSLTANKSYTLTIENIEDKYGNLMPTRNVSFIAIASSLDTTAPSFSYAYAENSKEVHISFDEAIATYPASMTVGTLTLTYSGRINDRSTVVYKVTGSTMNNGTYTFPANVPAQTEFKDAAGNKVDISGKTFEGIKDVTNYAPTVEYIEQTNAKTIVISFSEPVELSTVNNAITTTYKVNNVVNNGPVGKASRVDSSSINSHETEWKVEFTTKLAYDTKYTVALNAEDLGGEVVATGEFTADYYDDVAPSIVGVTASNDSTVVVEYDEELDQAGNYQIYYINTNGNKVSANVGGTVVSTAKNKVQITYTTKGSEIYYLTTKAGALDYSGNREKADETEWDFIGSDVKVTKNYVSGVKIINAKEISVNANFDIVTATVYEIKGDVRTVVGHVYDQDDTSVTVDMNVALLDGVEYEVIAKDSDDSEYKFNFKGVTPDLGLTIEGGVVKSYGVAVDTSAERAYDIKVRNAAGNEVAYNTPGVYYVELLKVNTDIVLYSARIVVPVPAN